MRQLPTLREVAAWVLASSDASYDLPFDERVALTGDVVRACHPFCDTDGFSCVSIDADSQPIAVKQILEG